MSENISSLIPVEQDYPEVCYLITLTEGVLFPQMVVPLVVEEEENRKVLGLLDENKPLLVASSLNPETGQAEEIGCLVEVKKMIHLHDEKLSVALACHKRVKIEKKIKSSPVKIVKVSYPDEKIDDQRKLEANAYVIRKVVDEAIKLTPNLPREFQIAVNNIDDYGKLADFIAINFNINVTERQKILATFDINERLELILELLYRELDLLKLGSKVEEEIRKRIEKNQREFYLREQLKSIKKELGEDLDDQDAVTDEYLEKILKAKLPEKVYEKAKKELSRLQMLLPESAEYSVIRNYLDVIVELPWSKKTKDNLNLESCKKSLDKDHYGLERVKERILEFLAVSKLNPERKGVILCLAGPPGVGKTSLGHSIAKALGRKFYRFSVGGMRDEAEIKGHRRTYVGAMPGKILQSMKSCNTTNPLILIDEIDKMGKDFRGDPASAMLEVLDPEQNKTFLDHYLDLPYDLSDVMFVCTANYVESIPAPLLDRMEIIEINSYIPEEKLAIAKKHLLLKERKEHGLTYRQIYIRDSAYQKIIESYTRESGVRNLQREIASVCRKVAYKVSRGDRAAQKITGENLNQYLGPEKYFHDQAKRKLKPGMAIGLAWTPVGGEILNIESALVKGSDKIIITGKLGDVMKESIQIAVSHIKSKANEYAVDLERLKGMDLHIHFPAGAVPKDGPSAGITIATALIGLLRKKPKGPKMHCAMTGEITIYGDILEVGGIQEKVIAARNQKIKTLFLPKTNQAQFEEIPEYVRKDLKVNFVSHYSEVFEKLF